MTTLNRENALNPRRRLATARRRRGAATVELAILLPLIVVVTLGSIEAASMIFLRQALVQSAYEAAKVIVKTGDEDLARANALGVTKGRRINGVTIEFDPTDPSTAERGELIRVMVSAPGDSNTSIPFGVFRGRSVAAQASMIRE